MADRMRRTLLAVRDRYRAGDTIEAIAADYDWLPEDVTALLDGLLPADTQRHAEAVRAAVNASCTCGGRGPEDEGVCPACRVWHGDSARDSARP